MINVEGPHHVVCQCDRCKLESQEPQIAFNAVVVGYVAPQRTWVGLTIEEIAACCMESTTTQLSFYNAIEAKLKELNA